MTSTTPEHIRPATTEWPLAPPLAGLLLAWAALVGAALMQHLLGWDDDNRIWLLDMDVERSLYTWFSQLMLAGAGVLLLHTGLSVLAEKRARGAQWLLLGAVFLALSADEALSLHEMLSAPVGSRLGTSGWLTFAWVIPVAAACLVGLMAFVPFLRALPAKVRATMLLAAALFFAGAIGMELIGAQLYSDTDGDVTTSGYRLAAIIEEAMEGLGVLVFIHAIMLFREERQISPVLG